MKKSKLSARIFKIKPGKKDQWVSWCKEINSVLRETAIETIKEENILRECFMTFSIDANDYAIGITEDFGDFLPANQTKAINQKHRAIKKECFESSIEVVSNYDISI